MFIMNSKQKLILVLIVLGYIFSSLLRIKFNLSDGFEFHDFWFTLLPFPFFKIAVESSDVSWLTSTIFGYLFYAFAAIVLIKTSLGSKTGFLMSIAFVLAVIYAIYVEGSSFSQDLNSNYIGQFLHIGPFLGVLGALVFLKVRK